MKRAALITGSAKRLGAYVAEMLASRGYDVVLHYNKSYKEALSLRDRLRKLYGVNAELYQADLISSDNLKDIVENAFCFFPHLNLLVNNASFFSQDSVETANEEMFDDYYRIHVRAPFVLTQSFLTHKPVEGKVINIVDTLIERKGSKKYFSYLFSKKCLHELTQMLQSSIQSKEIGIHSINPKIVIKEDGSFDCGNLEKFKNEIERIFYLKTS